MPVFKTGAFNRSATPPGVPHAGWRARAQATWKPVRGPAGPAAPFFHRPPRRRRRGIPQPSMPPRRRRGL